MSNWVLKNKDGGIIDQDQLWGVATYLLYGKRPDSGDFLEAIICDRPFSEVIPRADDNNRMCLMTWHRLLYNLFPRPAHGSHENMVAWCRHGGTSGVIPQYLTTYLPPGVE